MNGFNRLDETEGRARNRSVQLSSWRKATAIVSLLGHHWLSYQDRNTTFLAEAYPDVKGGGGDDK